MNRNWLSGAHIVDVDIQRGDSESVLMKGSFVQIVDNRRNMPLNPDHLMLLVMRALHDVVHE